MKIHHFYIVAFTLSCATLPFYGTAFIHGTSSIRRDVVPAWGLKSWTIERGSFLSQTSSSSSPEQSKSAASAGDDELDDERKANLFQFLLRDLQVEGVPLLAVDSNQVETLQAALWTTMAELMENINDSDIPQKVCLVFEEIPMDALRSLADEFMIFKTQNQALSELERVTLSLLGKGKVGPAMILEVSKVTKTSSTSIPLSNKGNDLDEIKYAAAMKAFSSRLLEKTDVYPYHQQNGVHFNTAYRFCSFSDVSHIMSSFWNCICELTANPDIATTVLVLPGLLSRENNKDNAGRRFAGLTQLMSRTLCLFRGNDVYELLYFSPTYNRDEIDPADELVHGHLPPRSWIQSILRHDSKNGMDNQELAQVLWDYQRRAPVPAIVIKRVALLQDSADSPIVDLALPSGKVQQVMAIDIAAYARNALYLSQKGKDALQTDLELEMSVYK